VIRRHSGVSIRCSPWVSRRASLSWGWWKSAWPRRAGHPAQESGGWQRRHRRTADRRLPGGVAGGWNLIGRTPAKLFDRQRDGYSLMQPGDTVRFEAVGHAEFINLGGDDTPLEAPGMSRLTIEASTPLCLLQDAGRFGVRHLGVTQGGGWIGFDVWANWLLGNRLDAPVVEITLGGFTVVAEEDCVLALAGADLGAGGR
jgi:hypothetical protein